MEKFSKHMKSLYETIINMDSFDRLSAQPSKVLFLSLGYRNKRAVVFSSNKPSFEEAWNSLYQQATHYLAIDSAPVEFLKIDWVDSQTTLPIPRFLELISKSKKNHFRYGISFDPQFRHAFLEQEVHANEMIHYHEKTGRAFLHAKNIMAYVAKYRHGIFRMNLKEVKSITIFTTQSVFLENGQCLILKNDLLNNGRRNTPFTREELEEIIISGMSYLADANQETGKFTNGYFPCTDKNIESDNMLSHGSALYAMLEAFELFKNDNTAHAIKRGLNFLVKHGIFIDKKAGFAYVADRLGEGNYEVKLGANASAILSIVKYTEVFGDRSYLPVAKLLAKGIVRLQRNEGNFAHVLHFPSLAVKQAFRIQAYETEAVLALLRLYGVDPEHEWLTSAETALNYFIKHGYWKKPDHFLGACINEIIKIRPDKRYFKIGLQLIYKRLDFIDKQEIIFPVFLQMLLEGYKLLQHQDKFTTGQPFKEFEQKLEAVIRRRAEYQRNGYFYPELAIYFKNPQRIMGGFFSRYHSFRIRIDETAGYLSGYCDYYKLFFSEEGERTTADPAEKGVRADDALGLATAGLPLQETPVIAAVETGQPMEADAEIPLPKPDQEAEKVPDEKDIQPSKEEVLSDTGPPGEALEEITEEVAEAGEHEVLAEPAREDSAPMSETEEEPEPIAGPDEKADEVAPEDGKPAGHKADAETVPASADSKETEADIKDEPGEEEESKPVESPESAEEMPAEEDKPGIEKSQEEVRIPVEEKVIEESVPTEKVDVVEPDISSEVSVSEIDISEIVVKPDDFKEEPGTSPKPVGVPGEEKKPPQVQDEPEEMTTAEEADKEEQDLDLERESPERDEREPGQEEEQFLPDEQLEQQVGKAEIFPEKEDTAEPEQDITQAGPSLPEIQEEKTEIDSEDEKSAQLVSELRKQNESALEALRQSEKLILNLTNQLIDLTEQVANLTGEVNALRQRVAEAEEKQKSIEQAEKLQEPEVEIQEDAQMIVEKGPEVPEKDRHEEADDRLEEPGNLTDKPETVGTVPEKKDIEKSLEGLVEGLHLKSPAEILVLKGLITEIIKQLSAEGLVSGVPPVSVRSEPAAKEQEIPLPKETEKEPAERPEAKKVHPPPELTDLERPSVTDDTIECPFEKSIDEATPQEDLKQKEKIEKEPVLIPSDEPPKSEPGIDVSKELLTEEKQEEPEIEKDIKDIVQEEQPEKSSLEEEPAIPSEQEPEIESPVSEDLLGRVEVAPSEIQEEIDFEKQTLQPETVEKAEEQIELKFEPEDDGEIETQKESVSEPEEHEEVPDEPKGLKKLFSVFKKKPKEDESSEEVSEFEKEPPSEQEEETPEDREPQVIAEIITEAKDVPVEPKPEFEPEAEEPSVSPEPEKEAEVEKVEESVEGEQPEQIFEPEPEPEEEQPVYELEAEPEPEGPSEEPEEPKGLRKLFSVFKKKPKEDESSEEVAEFEKELPSEREEETLEDRESQVIAEIVTEAKEVLDEPKLESEPEAEEPSVSPESEKEAEVEEVEESVELAPPEQIAEPESEPESESEFEEPSEEPKERKGIRKLFSVFKRKPKKEEISGKVVSELDAEPSSEFEEKKSEEQAPSVYPESEIATKEQPVSPELEAEAELTADEAHEPAEAEPPEQVTEPETEPETEPPVSEPESEPESEEPAEELKERKGIRKLFSVFKRKPKEEELSEEVPEIDSESLTEQEERITKDEVSMVPESETEEKTAFVELEETKPEHHVEEFVEVAQPEKTSEPETKTEAGLSVSKPESDSEPEEPSGEPDKPKGFRRLFSVFKRKPKEGALAEEEISELDAEITSELAVEHAEEPPEQIGEPETEMAEIPVTAAEEEGKHPAHIQEGRKPEAGVPETVHLDQIKIITQETDQPAGPEVERPETEEKSAVDTEKPSEENLRQLDETEFEMDWEQVAEKLLEMQKKTAEQQEEPGLTKVQEELESPSETTGADLSDKKQTRKKFIRRLGNVLISVGLLITAYFGYTFISMKIAENNALDEAKSQLSLRENPAEFEALELARKKKEIENYQAEYGKAFATLEIPKLGKTLPILEGTDAEVLKKGVGHLVQSVFPGQNEQIVISGHRDTVFRGFEKLEIGDLFIVHMPYGTYTYEMRETEIVDKDDTSVVRSMGEEVLVVTTCYPFYYIGPAPMRFVIYAYPVENEPATVKTE